MKLLILFLSANCLTIVELGSLYKAVKQYSFKSEVKARYEEQRINNFLFVHQQSNREQYIIACLIESQEEAKGFCLSSVSGLLRGFFL